MRRMVSLLLSFFIIFALTACSQSAASEKQEVTQPVVQKTEEPPETSQNMTEAEKQKTEESTNMEMELQESISAEQEEADVSTKTLVVYFSCTGTTELVAEYITEILGADSYQIVPEDPYTEADLAYYTNGRADQEQNDPDVRPGISGGVENMDEYDTIILGYPNWWGTMPMAMFTFLESYDFAGMATQT